MEEGKDAYDEENHPKRRHDDDYEDEREALSFWASMALIIGIGCFVTAFFGGGLYILMVEQTPWIITQFKNNFASLVAVPLSMIGSMAVVMILKYTDGPVEFDAPMGIKFKGAAAPIVFFILVFSVNIAAIKLLWNDTPYPAVISAPVTP